MTINENELILCKCVNLQLLSFHIRDVGVDGLKHISFQKEQVQTSVCELLKNWGADECFYLATCNRVEFLVLSKEHIEKNIFFKSFHTKPKMFFKPEEIIRHLLEVACSLDSVVFGENQILGQIKSSFTDQQNLGLVGAGLSKILNLVLREAKKIRTQTQLSRLQTSVSSVAAKIIQQKFKNNASVLMVGYGETHKLLQKSLEKKKFKNLSVTNRTQSKIESIEVAQKISWLDFQSAHLTPFDVISFATSSEKKLLSSKILKKTSAKLIVDLCVPPNADAKLCKKMGAEYIGLGEIQKTLEKDRRKANAVKKELSVYISNSTKNILADISVQSINTIIAENIQKSMELHRDALSTDIEKLLGPLTDQQKNNLALWSEKLIKKINHLHLKTYKEVASLQHDSSKN